MILQNHPRALFKESLNSNVIFFDLYYLFAILFGTVYVFQKRVQYHRWQVQAVSLRGGHRTKRIVLNKITALNFHNVRMKLENNIGKKRKTCWWDDPKYTANWRSQRWSPAPQRARLLQNPHWRKEEQTSSGCLWIKKRNKRQSKQNTILERPKSMLYTKATVTGWHKWSSRQTLSYIELRDWNKIYKCWGCTHKLFTYKILCDASLRL